MFFVLELSAQSTNTTEIERKPDAIDVFLHNLDSTHSTNISSINRIIHRAYDRFAVHAEWKLNNSLTRTELAYWEWFTGYLQIMSHRDIEGGFIHANRALNLTNDSSDLRCKIQILRAHYFDYTMEYQKEIEALDEINCLTVKNTGEPLFWVCVKKANLLQRMDKINEAIENYNVAIELGHNDNVELAELYYERALAQLHYTNDSAKVMSDLEDAIALNDEEPKYLYEHARLCREWHSNKADYQAEIKKDCEKILLLDTTPTLSSIRHCALALLGRRFEAERWIDRVMAGFGDKQSNWGYIYYNKAAIFALLNDVEQAIEYLNEAEKHGGISCAKIRDDANFYNLIGTDDFEELMLRICMN